MKLKDIMTPNVENVSLDTKLSEAARKMASLDVGFLPVSDASGIVGVITDRDIVVRSVAKGEDPSQTPVKNAMTDHCEALSEDTEVEEAAKLMEKKQIRRILVKGNHDRWTGVVSLGDLAVKTHDEKLAGDALEEISKPVGPTR